MAETVAESPPENAIDYQTALALKAKGYTYKEIAAEMGCKANTLRIAFARKGYTKHVAKATKGIQTATVKSVSRIQEGGSEQAKAAISDELLGHLKLMAQQPFSYKDLPNAGQGRASVLKTLAETAKTIYGWGNDSVTISFGVSMLSDRPEPKAVEVQAVVTSAPTHSVCHSDKDGQMDTDPPPQEKSPFVSGSPATE